MESADVTQVPPPPVDIKGTAMRVITKRIMSKLKRGVYTAKVRVECPATEPGGCKGTLALQTAKSVSISGVKVPSVLWARRATRCGPASARR